MENRVLTKLSVIRTYAHINYEWRRPLNIIWWSQALNWHWTRQPVMLIPVQPSSRRNTVCRGSSSAANTRHSSRSIPNGTTTQLHLHPRQSEIVPSSTATVISRSSATMFQPNKASFQINSVPVTLSWFNKDDFRIKSSAVTVLLKVGRRLRYYLAAINVFLRAPLGNIP